jgi:YHS domain-containing protein
LIATCVRPIVAVADATPAMSIESNDEADEKLTAHVETPKSGDDVDVPNKPEAAVPSAESVVEWDVNVAESIPEVRVHVQASHWQKTRSPSRDDRTIVRTSGEGSALTTIQDVMMAAIDMESGVDLTDLKSVCLVTLIDERRFVKAAPEFTAEHYSQQYQFSSAEARDKFKSNPSRYAPAIGGLDIVSFRNEQGVAMGSLSSAVLYRHRLYLFECEQNAHAFRRYPERFVSSD